MISFLESSCLGISTGTLKLHISVLLPEIFLQAIHLPIVPLAHFPDLQPVCFNPRGV